ncbi:class I SAM-dependent methyltransferase [Desulfonema magnum]|uniref:SAM-dependent DNA methylase domain-containing protein n=1 Tax=Desulfonema magnum TaxID=45655 RepID=A0A975BLZ1_9BACT|nr:class I SAM-dependent methyltransferase [Desulfonema magnum]QTA87905.1 SAM-dependent DNA methylase domain-containing protein [Desulfonema magnum]
MKMEKKGYKIIEDPKDGFLRIHPIPSDEDLKKYYEEEFYQSYQQFNDSSLEVQKAQKEFFDWRWGDIHRVLKKFFNEKDEKESLSIFDVGCGFSQALIYFKNQGYEVAGMEIAEEAVEYAKKEDINVIQGGIDDIDKVGAKYDVVLMLDVLEHLPGPADALKAIREKILNPSGMLVIDVPNDFNEFQKAADEVHHLDQWWFVPPNHINYFSVPSLQKLVSACGYEVFYCETTFPLELFLLMGDVYVGNSELGPKCHQKRVTFERTLRNSGREELLHQFYESLAKVGLGRQIVLFCYPKS